MYNERKRVVAMFVIVACQQKKTFLLTSSLTCFASQSLKSCLLSSRTHRVTTALTTSATTAAVTISRTTITVIIQL